MIRRGATFEVRDVEHRGVAAVEKRPAEVRASESLAREARLLSLARGRGLPALLDVGRDDRGPFLVEARVDGVPLGEVRDAWAGLPFPLAIHLARELARTYDELHDLADDHGSLEAAHGDPSFDNVLVTPVGRVALVDFGEAHARGATIAPRQAGTPPYAAPELLRGEAAPSQRTDRYAVAAMVLALVSPVALRPELEVAARLHRLVSVGIDRAALDAAPAALREPLARLLRLDAEAREASLSSLRAALERVCCVQ
ncbi:MAG: hypothetical protein U0414_26850 [Polyangiaceae bacterium]